MNIAFVITSLATGGAEKCLTELVLRLDRKRFSPTVFSLQPRPAPSRDALVRRLEQAGVPLVFLGATSLWQLPWVVWTLRQELRRLSCDCVQTFLFHANVTGLLAARLAGVKFVALGLRVADPSRWRRSLERCVYPLANRIVCVSSGVCRDYARTCPGWKMDVIANGIDATLHENVAPADLSSLGIPPHVPILLLAGRLQRQKGLDWFLSALPEVLARWPHHVCVAGEGPEREKLLRQASAAAIAPRVHFLGQRDDLPSLFRRAALLVLPSRYEGMANVALEALATGTPVLMTEVSGSDELLGPWHDEFTIPFGDTPALVARLAALLSDPAKLLASAARLRQRMAEQFTWDIMTSAYEEVWREGKILSGEPPPPVNQRSD